MADMSCVDRERAVAAARAQFATAMLKTEQALAPAALLTRAKDTAYAAAAPLIDALVQQTKTSSGWIVLGGSAAAILFALGRSSVSQGDAHNKTEVKAEDGVRPSPEKEHIPNRASNENSFSLNSALRAIALAAGGMAAGAVLASRRPLTDIEKERGGAIARELADLAWNMAQKHSKDALSAAVHSFGVARGAGTLLAILAAISRAGSDRAAAK